MPDGNWLSHVSRPFEIAKALRAMGHEVMFAGEGQYMRLPRESGFPVLPARTISPEFVLQCSRNGRANWYDYHQLKACVKDDLRIFNKVKPDIVLGDFRLSLSTSCELSGIPLAVVLNAAWTNYYSIRIRAPEHFRLTQILGRRITSWLAPLLKKLIIVYDSIPFQRLRSEYGISRRTNIWDIWRGDLNLIADIPEYGPTRNLPPHFHYIGPIVWEPQMKVPGWLKRLDPARPTIYFTMGSTGYPRFFPQAVEIFRNSDYQCIMTTAGMTRLSSVPDNIFVTDYAPGSEIMEKSDVVVCHGGNGTIYQAMSKGVPIIGIPTMHDQEFNLDRVSELGIGIHLSELKFKPEHLLEAVKIVLTDKKYRTNAEHYMNKLKMYNGSQRGAELIEDFGKTVC